MRPDFFGSLFQDRKSAKTDGKDNSVRTGECPTRSEKSAHTNNTTSKQTITPDRLLKTEESYSSRNLPGTDFLAQVTRGLGVDVPTLLELGVLIHQDIADMDCSMYGREHIADYQETVAQRLHQVWGSKVVLTGRSPNATISTPEEIENT